MKEKNPLRRELVSLPSAALGPLSGRMKRRQQQIEFLEAASTVEELLYGPGIDDSMYVLRKKLFSSCKLKLKL